MFGDRTAVIKLISIIIYVITIYISGNYFNDTLKALKIQKDSLEQEIQLQNAYANVPNIKSLSEKMFKLLPKSQNKGDIVNMVSGLASKNGIKVTSLAVNMIANPAIAAVPEGGPAVAGALPTIPEVVLFTPKYKTSNVTLNVAGSTSQIKSFVSDLEKSERLVDILTLSLTKSTETKSGSSDTATALSFNVYSQK